MCARSMSEWQPLKLLVMIIDVANGHSVYSGPLSWAHWFQVCPVSSECSPCARIATRHLSERVDAASGTMIYLDVLALQHWTAVDKSYLN